MQCIKVKSIQSSQGTSPCLQLLKSKSPRSHSSSLPLRVDSYRKATKQHCRTKCFWCISLCPKNHIHAFGAFLQVSEPCRRTGEISISRESLIFNGHHGCCVVPKWVALNAATDSDHKVPKVCTGLMLLRNACEKISLLGSC